LGGVPPRRRLGWEECRRIVDILLPFYRPGRRNYIVFSLLGMLIKSGVDYRSARRVVWLLATKAGDEEKWHRLYLVDYHYRGRAEAVGVTRLKGASGLREQVEDAAIELGHDSESAAKIASRVVAEIRAILRAGRRGAGAGLKGGGRTKVPA